MRSKLGGVALVALLVVAGVYIALPRLAKQRTTDDAQQPVARNDGGGAAIAPESAAKPTPGAAELRSKMARIPGAEFMMGANDSSDSRPIHRVRIDPFELDTTEVTVHDYQACVAAGACVALGGVGQTCNAGKSDRDNHPINCLNASEADAFCRWAGKRLPTEEEWEYAARGTDSRKYPWGNEAPDDRACWRRSRESAGTCEVGSHPNGVSPFGLYDMAGNVLEWTSSALSKNYASERSLPERVMRGGCWSDVDPTYLTSSARGRWDPRERLNIAGVRCAR